MRLSYVNIIFVRAGMSELADEADSKSVDGNIVWVQVPPPALKKTGKQLFTCFFVSSLFRFFILLPQFPVLSVEQDYRSTDCNQIRHRLCQKDCHDLIREYTG